MKQIKIKRYSKQGRRWILWDVQLETVERMPRKKVYLYRDPDTKQLCKDVVTHAQS